MLLVLQQIFKRFARVSSGRMPVVHFHRKYGRESHPKRQTISNAFIRVIGSGSPGEPASFALNTNGRGHLFNCGQGTDRLARCQRLLRWTNVDNVFITRLNWSNIGGLLAAMNEITQISGKARFTIHGPAKLKPIIERMSSIVDVPKTLLNFNCTDSYVTKGLQIDLLPLSNNNDNMAYVCRLEAYRGALNLGKCVDYDIPGERIRDIHKFNLTDLFPLPDGRLISVSELYDHTDEERSFMVVDIATQEHLHSLRNNETFAELLRANKRLDAVVHFTPPHTFDESDYKSFLQYTNAQRHLVINSSNKYSGLLGVHKCQVAFNQLNPYIFPLLKSSVDPKPAQYIATEDGRGTIHGVSSNTILKLRKIDEEADEVMMDTADTSFRSDDDQTAARSNIYPKIIFLGTTSQRSGTFRNVSSILLHTSENSCILLDCGEDTCGQIIRFYGSNATEIFRKIKAIFISHLHGDHHYGLFDILLQRKHVRLLNTPPILLLTPCKEYTDWVMFCSDHVENISNEFKLIDNNDLLTSDLDEDTLTYLDVRSLRTCLVDHIASSFGMSTTIPERSENAPFKLTYSGDTMPCDSLVKLGLNSTLLIHEATFENALLERAQNSKHSTIAQAIGQGVKMNAKYTILTHFSQRYAILPWIDDDLGANIGIASDNMEVIEQDLSELSAFRPRMEMIFSDHFRNIEKRAQHNKSRHMYQEQ